MKSAIAIAAALVVMTGCAGQQSLKSENAELKSQVSALQSQVADLRAENAKLAASAATPLTIDGLKLEPPKFGELRFTTPTSGPRPLNYTGATHLVAGNGSADAVTIGGPNWIGTVEQSGGALIIRNNDLQVGGIGQTVTIHKSAAPATNSTTTVPATTPQK